MKVLVDTNIILDFLLQREPFQVDANALFEVIGNRQVVGYVTATTITDIFYIVRRTTKNIDRSRQAVSEILKTMQICTINRIILETAVTSGLRDFEDAVQLAAAVANSLEAIITRNPQDFPEAILPILSVNELLEQVENYNND